MFNEAALDYDSKYELWEQGEIPDAFGHWVGDGYEFNNPYPTCDEDLSYDEEDEEANEELKIVKEWESNDKPL